MGRKAFGIGMSLVLSLMMAHLPIGAHACCCGDEARIETSCAACPPACGTVGAAPCCPRGAAELRAPAHADAHHPAHVIPASHNGAVTSGHATTQSPPPTRLSRPPLFIVHRALLL